MWQNFKSLHLFVTHLSGHTSHRLVSLKGGKNRSQCDRLHWAKLSKHPKPVCLTILECVCCRAGVCLGKPPISAQCQALLRPCVVDLECSCVLPWGQAWCQSRWHQCYVENGNPDVQTIITMYAVLIGIHIHMDHWRREPGIWRLHLANFKSFSQLVFAVWEQLSPPTDNGECRRRTTKRGLQISVYIANKKSDCCNSGSLFGRWSVFSHWHSLVEEMFFIYFRVALARVLC